jgi:hypothetical protein
MAKVPSGKNITSWLPGSSAVWFKVAQSGKATDGTWAAPTALLASNSIYTFTVPSALAPGQYLIRHEMFVLPIIYDLSTINRSLTASPCTRRTPTLVLRSTRVARRYRSRARAQRLPRAPISSRSRVLTLGPPLESCTTFTPVSTPSSHHLCQVTDCLCADTSAYPIPGPALWTGA